MRLLIFGRWGRKRIVRPTKTMRDTTFLLQFYYSRNSRKKLFGSRSRCSAVWSFILERVVATVWKRDEMKIEDGEKLQAVEIDLEPEKKVGTER